MTFGPNLETRCTHSFTYCLQQLYAVMTELNSGELYFAQSLNYLLFGSFQKKSVGHWSYVLHCVP